MILHIMADSAKHINYPFIDFINEYFDKNNHYFILCSADKDIKKFENAVTKDLFTQEKFFIDNMKKAKKIILHGIWYDKLCEILLENENFFEKIYWVIWGGDFYFPEKQSEIKKEVIKKIKNFVTYIKEDFDLVKKWYNINGQYYECLMYLSNTYKQVFYLPNKNHSKFHILVGNSADPTNNHIEIFKKLIKYKNKNILIFVPLSYGDKQYAKKIANIGKKIFKNKFIPILKPMSLKDYIKFLSTIDIAIFNHNRQQAMGNTITLLGLGKKVYMKNNVTSWRFFKDLDVKVFNVKNIELSLINERIKKDNQKKIKEYFSKENLIKQLEILFKV